MNSDGCLKKHPFGFLQIQPEIEQIFEKTLCAYAESDIIRAENMEGIEDASV